MPDDPNAHGEPKEAAPAAGLVGVVPVTALALWIVNDQLLKAHWPGPVTGILSDVAGLVVVPLAVQAACELMLWAAGRWRGPSLRVLTAAIVAVGGAFALVQVWPIATDAYRWGLGLLQWPFSALSSALGGSSAPAVAPVMAVGDAADLLALPALLLSWWSGRRRVARVSTCRPAGPNAPDPPEAAHSAMA